MTKQRLQSRNVGLIATTKIKSATVVRYPVVRIVFDDGVEGEIDHSDHVANGQMFEPLRDRKLFDLVAVDEYGHSYGWNLHNEGDEIDFGADSTRTRIETQIVAVLAERYRRHRSAAE